MNLDEMLRVDRCRTWTNCLTFEPDSDHSPDAGTGLLAPISYKRCNAEFYYVGKIPCIYWPPVAAARRGFKMVLFTASRRNKFVRGICALPSALTVSSVCPSESCGRELSNVFGLPLCQTVSLSTLYSWLVESGLHNFDKSILFCRQIYF